MSGQRDPMALIHWDARCVISPRISPGGPAAIGDESRIVEHVNRGVRPQGVSQVPVEAVDEGLNAMVSAHRRVIGIEGSNQVLHQQLRSGRRVPAETLSDSLVEVENFVDELPALVLCQRRKTRNRIGKYILQIESYNDHMGLKLVKAAVGIQDLLSELIVVGLVQGRTNSAEHQLNTQKRKYKIHR